MKHTTDPGRRTAEERSTAADESAKDSTGSRLGETQEDRPDQSSTQPPRDAADSADKRSRRDAATAEITQSSSDSTSTVQDASHRLPADLREKMLQDPVFTRLGWGADDHFDDDDDDDITPDEEAEVRTSETDDHVPLEQPDVDANQHTTNGDAKVDEPTAIKVLEAAPVADRPAVPEGSNVASPGDEAEDTAEDGTREAPLIETSTRSDDLNPGTDLENQPSENPDADAPEAIDHSTSAELPSSAYSDLVAEQDKHWDAAEANLPPGRLPESARDLGPEIIESMSPDVRRLLEYQGATEYIAENATARPWLEPAADASPAVQRIFTAIDQGTGHAHIRHGPMGNDQMYADRVTYLEDPAQTDVAKREAGIDGLNPTKMHRCGREATRIHDAEAFVTAFAAAVKLPDVQAALATPVGPTIDPPDSAKVPISELLGHDGHKYCSGYRLDGGQEAWQARKEWLKARANGEDLSGLPEPRAKPIETFEGGNVIIRFKSNGKAYEINTLFVEPPAADQ